MKTLVVDDEWASRGLLEQILQPYGECVMAEDGLQAVALFKEHLSRGEPFDLVLLDIMMPNMGGQEVLREIRLIEKRIIGVTLTRKNNSFIVMQTCLDDPKCLIDSFLKGRCNGYITKPIDQNELLDKLKKNHLIETELSP
ncbi:MAG: response regulator [Magnetococcales bacterium]|nr:response regulator [Magnetococcales bacterium]